MNFIICFLVNVRTENIMPLVITREKGKKIVTNVSIHLKKKIYTNYFMYVIIFIVQAIRVFLC